MSEDLIPLLSLLVKSSLIVLCAYALTSALKALRVEAAARHLVWLTAFVALALLPLLTLALPDINIALPYATLGFATPDLTTPGEHVRDWTGAIWLWSAYAIGAGAMLMKLAAARANLAALWRRAQPCELVDLNDIAQRAGVRGKVDVRIADQKIAPLTWGSRVLLPAGAADWPPARTRDVLLHELSHMARRDSLTQMLATTVRAGFWFSPAVWFALKELRVEQEHACDERVVASGADSIGYAQTLLDVAAGSQSPPPGMGVSTAMVQPSNLERRVLAILEPRHTRTLSLVTIAGLSAALLCTGGALAAARPHDIARTLEPLPPLTTPLSSEMPRLGTLPPLTARVNVPEAQDANSTR